MTCGGGQNVSGVKVSNVNVTMAMLKRSLEEKRTLIRNKLVTGLNDRFGYRRCVNAVLDYEEVLGQCSDPRSSDGDNLGIEDVTDKVYDWIKVLHGALLAGRDGLKNFNCGQRLNTGLNEVSDNNPLIASYLKHHGLTKEEARSLPTSLERKSCGRPKTRTLNLLKDHFKQNQAFFNETDESFKMHTAVLLFWYCNTDGKIEASF